MGRLKKKIGRKHKKGRNNKTEVKNETSPMQPSPSPVLSDTEHAYHSVARPVQPALNCDFRGDFLNCDCVLHHADADASQDHCPSVGVREAAADEFYVIIGRVAHRHQEHDNVDKIVSSRLRVSFGKLKKEVMQCEQKFSDHNFNVQKCAKKLNLVQFYESENGVTTSTIKTCVTIDNRLQLMITVEGKELPADHVAYQNISKVRTASTLLSIIQCINNIYVCSGNKTDQQHVDALDPSKSKKADLETYVNTDKADQQHVDALDPSKSKKADLETDVNTEMSSRTLRSISCPLWTSIFVSGLTTGLVFCIYACMNVSH